MGRRLKRRRETRSPRKMKGRWVYTKQQWHDLRWRVYNIPSTRGEERGIAAETKTAEALKLLAEKGKIKRWEQTKRYSQLDREGVDFVVILPDNHPIFCQVKSRYDRTLEEEYRDRGICYLAVFPQVSMQNTALYVEKAIKEFCRTPPAKDGI